VTTNEAVAAGRWIVSPRYDLGFFFGGAAASLAALGLYLAGVPILVLWWTWILAFDGPHIAAAFTRTYLDREEWRGRRRLLVSSLLFFAAGPLALLAGQALGSPEPFQLFLVFAVFYAYHHVVRQHYGFLALYTAVARAADERRLRRERWALYVGCWAPYAYFLLTHPRARALLRLDTEVVPGSPESLAAAVLLAAWVTCVAASVLRVWRERDRGPAPRSLYVTVTVALYGVIYVAVARAEPVYAGSTGPDQDFLLISVLVTLFHNVQYLGLVWFHNRNRYAGPGDFGAARLLAADPKWFLGGCLAFSLTVYLLLACATGVFPRCMILPATHIGPFAVGQVGLSLWWGLALHHYYLDQRIWRVRGDPALRRNLGLA
jgi:hypothetical protein